jgi:hypothetical protein
MAVIHNHVILPDTVLMCLSLTLRRHATNIHCVRKVAVQLGYGTYIWLSVSKLPLKCAVVTLYSDVKQRLKCNTGKVCNCLIQVLLIMVHENKCNTFYKCTATFRTHCTSLKQDRQYTYKSNIESRSRNNHCRGKALR